MGTKAGGHAIQLEEAGDEDVFRKVAKDLGAGKDAAIRQKMKELLDTAGEQVLGEAGK